MKSKRKPGVMEEGESELGRVAHAGHALARGRVRLPQARGAAIRQFLSLEIAPQVFHRVQVGGVTGQAFHSQPVPLASQVRLHDAALVSGQAVPDQGGLLAAQMPTQVAPEGDQALGVVAVGASLEIKTSAPVVPAVGQGGTKRELLPVEGVNQDRCLAARRPGATNGRALGDAALILEDDPGFAAPSVFFTAGHRSPTHWRTASLFRSRDCRAGRCKVQFIAPKIFQTWPGWYRTPVSRSITAATRGRVHKSVPKPWARAPWR